MKQKIFTALFFILFIGVFGYFYGDEYKDFYEQKLAIVEQQKLTEQSLKSFTPSNISKLKGTQLHVTPDTDLLDKIVEMIEASEDRVYLEVYIFTEKRVAEAMKKAHNRGVDVRVILEKNPYLAPSLNNKRYDLLSNWGISVTWSHTNNYALNHSKFLIIDDIVFISTGNMSYSTFTKNRDFFIQLDDPSVLATLLEVFYADSQGVRLSPYHDNLIVSPDYSREKIQELVASSKKSLYMYFQYMQDDELEKHILQKSREGVDIHIILDDDFYEEESEKINLLQDQGISVYKYPRSSMHAKAILVDMSHLFIGSINFSSYSLDKNREVGIIVSNQDVIQEFFNRFQADIER